MMRHDSTQRCDEHVGPPIGLTIVSTRAISSSHAAQSKGEMCMIKAGDVVERARIQGTYPDSGVPNHTPLPSLHDTEGRGCFVGKSRTRSEVGKYSRRPALIALDSAGVALRRPMVLPTTV